MTAPAPPAPPNQVVTTAPSALDSQLPAYLKENPDLIATSSSMITGHATVPAISIQGKQFCFPDEQPMPMGQALSVIILESDPPEGVAKTYYAAAFNPNVKDAPDCASSNGKFPDPFIAKPVSVSCDTCQWNMFGTGVDAQGQPSKGKRCSDFKNLYVVRDYDIGGTIFVIRVPATSLKALSGYGRHLRDRNVPPQAVITQIAFDNTTHPQLTFQPQAWLEEADGRRALERSQSTEMKGMLPSANSATGPRAASVAERSAGLALPSPAPAAPVMTAKANGATYESFIDAGWTKEKMVEGGYMEAPVATSTVPAAPTPAAPVPAPAEPVMTAKAGGITYQAYVAEGWSDEQLIASGFMEAK